MNIQELRQHVRKMVSQHVYENINGNYEAMAIDCQESVKEQNGVINDWGENEFWHTEGTGYVYGKLYEYWFDYKVISQKYVAGKTGDNYYTPEEELYNGVFDFEITNAEVIDKNGDGVVCNFDEVVKYIQGGYDTVKTWFHFDEQELINRDTLDEVVTKRTIAETTRRQKAVSAMEGTKGNIRTMAILSAENPRYDSYIEDNNETNKQRSKNIEKDLSIGHYAWFPVKGHYEGKENSYIVYNISLDNALYLGKKYGQESIIFIDGSRCEYWEQNGNGNFQKTHERFMKDIVDMTNADDYFTQISRGFKFQIPFFDGSNDNKTELNEMNRRVSETMNKRVPDLNERLRRIDGSMNALSGYNRFTNRSELYGNNFGKKEFC